MDFGCIYLSSWVITITIIYHQIIKGYIFERRRSRDRSELTIDDTETYEHVFKEWMQMNLDKVPPYVQRDKTQ